MEIIIDGEMFGLGDPKIATYGQLREVFVFWVADKMSNYKQSFAIVGDVDFLEEENISIKVISLGEDEDE